VSDYHSENTDSLGEQLVTLFNVKPGGIWSNLWYLINSCSIPEMDGKFHLPKASRPAQRHTQSLSKG